MKPPADQLAKRLRQLLGLGPVVDADGVVVSEAVEPHWVRTELRLAGKTATYLRPPGASASLPAVIYCHAHGGDYALGRRELTEGARWLQVPFARDLLAAGFAVLCIDMPGFGDRQSEGSESALAKAGLWRGHPLFGQMLADQMAAVGWLVAQEEIDAKRIAAVGMSMGGALACWLGALDARIAAVAQLCILADIEQLIAAGGHDRHGIFLTVPGLLAEADVGDVAALIAPRPQFVAHGATDHLTPPAARDPALARLQAAYTGSPGQLELFVAPDSGHFVTAEMRRATLAFLSRWAFGPADTSDAEGN